MSKKYQIDGITYNDFSKIRELFPNVSFPKALKQSDLASFNITMVEEEYIPTEEDILNSYKNQVQMYLDVTARERGYDGILSLCSYATSANSTFAREGQAGVEWRDAVWDACYVILKEVKAGSREIPTDLISELPLMTWGD